VLTHERHRHDPGAFAEYYRTTILAEETDPNKLHDLKTDLDGYQIYAATQVGDIVTLYLGGADRDRLDSILDILRRCLREQLDEDGQVDFKGKAKAFLRNLRLPVVDPAIHERRVGKAFDLPNLPRSQATGTDRGGLSRVSLRRLTWIATVLRKQAPMRIHLPDRGREIEPVPATGAATNLRQNSIGSRTSSDLNDSSATSRGPDADRDAQTDHRGHTEPRRADIAYQNQSSIRIGRTPASSIQGTIARDDRRAEG